MMIFNRRFAFHNLLLAIAREGRNHSVKSEECDGFRDASLGSGVRRAWLASIQDRRADVTEPTTPTLNQATELKRILS
jgi:hypothetical protein